MTLDFKRPRLMQRRQLPGPLQGWRPSPLTINGGSVTLAAANQIADTSAVILTSGGLNFNNQNVGTTSNPQTVTLNNTGNATLTVSIGVSGDYGESDNCGTSVAAGGSCSISRSQLWRRGATR